MQILSLRIDHMREYTFILICCVPQKPTLQKTPEKWVTAEGLRPGGITCHVCCMLRGHLKTSEINGTIVITI